MNNFKKISLVTASLLVLSSGSAIAEDKDWSVDSPSTMWDKSWRYNDAMTSINRKNHIQREFFIKKSKIAKKSSPQPIRVVRSNYQDLPPNPKLGECYARVQVPPEYKMVSERIQTKKGSSYYKIIPAEYKFVETKVQIEQSKKEVKIIPATYREIQEKILVQDAYDEIVTIPAEYKTVTEKVLVSQAYTTWEKGRGPIEKINNITGDIMCLVEVPAEYTEIVKDVLIKPAGTRVIKHAAQYTTVTKKVVDKAASVKKVTVTPAKYAVIKVKKLVRASYKKQVRIDPVYETIQRRVPITGGSLQWRSILCETNATPELFSALQTALKARKLYDGAVNGVLDVKTVDAMTVFQKSNDLPTGSLTIKTLKALGVQNW